MSHLESTGFLTSLIIEHEIEIIIVFILFVQKLNQVQSKASFCEHVMYQENEWKLNQGIVHHPHFPKVRNYSLYFSKLYALPILAKVFTRGLTGS